MFEPVSSHITRTWYNQTIVVWPLFLPLVFNGSHTNCTVLGYPAALYIYPAMLTVSFFPTNTRSEKKTARRHSNAYAFSFALRVFVYSQFKLVQENTFAVGRKIEIISTLPDSFRAIRVEAGLIHDPYLVNAVFFELSLMRGVC